MKADPNFYKYIYDGFELLDSFPSREALEHYRADLLGKSHQQSEFIVRHMGTDGLRVLEFCCGNARLLMSLAARPELAYGLGIEMSLDRVRFAEQWIADTGTANVECRQGDVLEYALDGDSSFDLVACISGTFGYFPTIAQSAPAELLRRANLALRPGGHLLLEVFQFTDRFRRSLELNEGLIRAWHPLPDSNPFAYQLDVFEYSSEFRTLRREKTFIRRDGGIDAGRSEYVADHSEAELVALAESAGFKAVASFADFGDAPFRAGESDRLVLLMQKT